MVKKRIWTDDERAAVGQDHRGVVGPFSDSDVTKPIEMIEAGAGEPMTNADGIRLWDRVDRLKVELGCKPGARLNSIDFKMKIVWGMLVFSLAGAGASLSKVIEYVGDQREAAVTLKRALEQSTACDTRLRTDEETLTRNAQRLDDLERAMNK